MANFIYDVISVGSATFDVFLRSKDFKLLKSKQFTTGVGICQAYGSKVEVEEMFLSSGGGGTNTAVGFSRLGLKTAVVSRLGDDFFGQMVVEELKKEGVDISLLIQKNGELTDYSSILLGADGGRTIFVYRGEARLEIREIDFGKLRAKWIYLASLEGNLKIVEKITKIKKEFAGVAFNPGSRELKQKGALKSLLKFIDVLIWNREEAEQFLGFSLEGRGFWLRASGLGPKIVAITDGHRGAYLLTGKDVFYSPAFQSKPIDETGAGDAFGSALVSGLIKRWPILKSFSLAMANGASVVAEIGAKTALLTSSQAERMLKRVPPIQKLPC